MWRDWYALCVSITTLKWFTHNEWGQAVSHNLCACIQMHTQYHYVDVIYTQYTFHGMSNMSCYVMLCHVLSWHCPTCHVMSCSVVTLPIIYIIFIHVMTLPIISSAMIHTQWMTTGSITQWKTLSSFMYLIRYTVWLNGWPCRHSQWMTTVSLNDKYAHTMTILDVTH